MEPPEPERQVGEDGELPEFVEVPLTEELDLHTFRPSEIGSLLPEYFRECRRRGWLTVRIIHGKGTGTLREGVHRLLDRLPEVVGYRPGDESSGGWGTTWVSLRPWSGDESDEK
ncbi:MAG: Smr/MutS family protein [Verrucomicrobiae bacterium]|nr:Smr/MutS family protein [Verrucomicrobiae bacterium]